MEVVPLNLLYALAIVVGAIAAAPSRPRTVYRLRLRHDRNGWPSTPPCARLTRPYDREVDR